MNNPGRGQLIITAGENVMQSLALAFWPGSTVGDDTMFVTLRQVGRGRQIFWWCPGGKGGHWSSGEVKCWIYLKDSVNECCIFEIRGIFSQHRVHQNKMSSQSNSSNQDLDDMSSSAFGKKIKIIPIYAEVISVASHQKGPYMSFWDLLTTHLFCLLYCSMLA